MTSPAEAIVRALARDELVLHFQPKADIADGRVTGVEALVRWQHPERGLLGAPDVLAAVEEADRLEELTAWVLDRALAQRAAWCAEGLELTVAVNVAPVSVLDPEFVDQVADALRRHDTPAHALDIEVTEGAIMAQDTVAAATLGRLRTMGVGLSIDDFGTGWSSLSRLRGMPFDEVKIDRSFVTGMSYDEDDRAIVRVVMDLARHFDRRVVAEGVEETDQLAWLAALGCDVVQGYLVSPPVAAHDLHDWVDGWRGLGPNGATTAVAPPEGERRVAETRTAAVHRLMVDSATAGVASGGAEALLARLVAATGAGAAALWTLDDREEELQCVSTTVADVVADDRFERMTRTLSLGRGRGMPGLVWESGVAQRREILPEDARYPRAAAALRAGLHSVLALPLLQDGVFVGVVELYASRADRRDDELTAAITELCAGPFATALHDAVQQGAAGSGEQVAAIAARAHADLAAAEPGDVRQVLCEALVAISGATTVLLWEAGAGGLVATTSAGRDVGLPVVRLAGETSAALAAYTSRRSAFFADLLASPAASARLASTVAATSGLFVPAVVGEASVGAVSILWAKRRRRPSPAVRHTVEGLLAHVAPLLGDDAAAAAS